MAFPAGPLYRVSIGGKLASDTWSVNLWADGAGTTGTPTAAQLGNFATEVFTDWDTNVWSIAASPLKGANTSAVDLSRVKVEFYNGGAIQQSADVGFTPVVGTGSTPHPGYTCLVATLLTALAGRSKRGRIYLPFTGLGLSASTLQLAGSTLAYTQHIAGRLASMNFTPGDLPGDPACHAVILSRTLGVITPITAVRMDTILDTQRGRQSKFIATGTNTTAV